MKTVKLTELDESVRTFLAQVPPGEGIRVDDDAGLPRFSVVPYRRATEEQRLAALARLVEIQRNTRAQMEREGKTEAELDRILQEDE
jgi:hypothetical protein